MKRPWLLGWLVIPWLVVTAQESAPPGFEQWTAASLKQLGASLSGEASRDPHHFAVRQLSDYSNESFLLVHREADGQVEWHETQTDVFLVESGSATLVVGGTMICTELETVAVEESELRMLVRSSLPRSLLSAAT